MSHSVVRLVNCKVTSELEAENLCNELKTELENRGYQTNDVSIGDSTNLNGEVLLKANISFVYPSEADSWCNYLKKFVEAKLDKEDGIKEAVVDQHECMHMEGLNKPCKPVEWSFEV